VQLVYKLLQMANPRLLVIILTRHSELTNVSHLSNLFLCGMVRYYRLVMLFEGQSANFVATQLLLMDDIGQVRVTWIHQQ
jgi:hypothetical protein